MYMADITSAELKRKLRTVKIIDVREPEECVRGSIEGAEHKPLGALVRDVGKGVYAPPRDREIVCYCSAGVRGKIAADFLTSRGFKARNLEGGYLVWAASS